MFKLLVAALLLLMGDWIFFDGRAVVRPLTEMIEVGADRLADSVIPLLP